VLKARAYRFELALESSPEALWPLVSDTNRFNRDAGVPAVEPRGTGVNARRRLRLRRLGMPIEWEEEPFEWVSPHRFSVRRRYIRGPVAEMLVNATLTPTEGGGTKLVYEVEARPRNLLGRLAIPVEVGVLSRRRFIAAFRRYDQDAAKAAGRPAGPPPRLEDAVYRRIDRARDALVRAGCERELVDRLCAEIAGGDDLAVRRLRPYTLARAWGFGRRETLELCLQAVREGLLTLRWELLCPLCRGPAERATTLNAVAGELHCDTCRIDFSADFERSVEITFAPAPGVRAVEQDEYCVGGPQVTPHVISQQLLPPGGTSSHSPRLEPGRYRLRTLALPGALPVVVEHKGATAAEASAEPGGWRGELRLAEHATLMLENATEEEQLFVLERTRWSDEASTAAEVTALQVFRDLFAAEALRPGEPISVGTLTVVFTDLRGSTRYYREVGDAPAFGSVLEHVDVLREAVREEDGSVVKAMGDAIMAVFVHPVAAVRAMLAAQRAVAGRPLALKVGIHTGTALAVNQNGVLDYFGSTVNLAARLVELASGDDLVVSGVVLDDPEVAALGLPRTPIESALKGFEGETHAVWRLAPPKDR
jgi:class 3 adenylate cyclase